MVTSSAIDKMFEILGPIFEQNVAHFKSHTSSGNMTELLKFYEYSGLRTSLCSHVMRSSVVFSKVDETTFFDPPFLLA